MIKQLLLGFALMAVVAAFATFSQPAKPAHAQTTTMTPSPTTTSTGTSSSTATPKAPATGHAFN